MLRTLKVTVWLVLLCSGVGVAESHAQRVEPWTPPWSDSLLTWTARARARFQTNVGDSISGSNYRPYELVGTVARRLIRSLGRDNMPQAHAVEAALNEKGLDTEILIDPEYPIFSVLMVRNPFSPTAKAVGFLYWYLQDDLRIQGAQFNGGRDPRMKVWWTGRRERPYTWAIVDRTRGGEEEMSLMLLQMNSDGHFFNLVQYEGKGPHLGAGEVSFADINGDIQPEMLAWTVANPDSTFEACDGCPRLMSESIFVERKHGFELHDSRLLPSPFSSFVLFVRLLRLGDRGGAARMLDRPALIDEAFALGWDRGRGRGVWRLIGTEPDQAWPRWLRFRYKGPEGTKAYTIRFAQKNARWVISDWSEVVPRGGIALPEEKSPSGGAKPE